MFHEIERELSDGEPWSFRHQPKFPIQLQLLVEQQQGRQDVWEIPEKEALTKKTQIKLYNSQLAE
ncbi:MULTISPECIES: hypothetical protein [Nostocales]|uniref:Uncharacterized protein n=3 Tax=Nostocales TaxID=1161 RepID=A0A0C1MXH1_9CYAN|nr:hypothetical protein [Tolypothrix bouteillei]KAF3889590.1 hypothetical protein DA73_0400032050 [Tolypothrix bouteillei VB521301]